ncbi:MAG: nitroreductase/quinone reductase family protein, partial [Myxococcota bacterium]
VVASKGGAPNHPLWYLNLAAEPSVDLQVATDKFRARARTSEGEERSALWELMAAIYSPYNDYQEAAGSREIPVVVLERLPE